MHYHYHHHSITPLLLSMVPPVILTTGKTMPNTNNKTVHCLLPGMEHGCRVISRCSFSRHFRLQNMLVFHSSVLCSANPPKRYGSLEELKRHAQATEGKQPLALLAVLAFLSNPPPTPPTPSPSPTPPWPARSEH